MKQLCVVITTVVLLASYLGGIVRWCFSCHNTSKQSEHLELASLPQILHHLRLLRNQEGTRGVAFLHQFKKTQHGRGDHDILNAIKQGTKRVNILWIKSAL